MDTHTQPVLHYSGLPRCLSLDAAGLWVCVHEQLAADPSAQETIFPQSTPPPWCSPEHPLRNAVRYKILQHRKCSHSCYVCIAIEDEFLSKYTNSGTIL